MTLSAMIYGVILAFLFAGAAHFLDRGLRILGRPTRWVWLGALLVGGLAPFLPGLLPAGVPEGSTGGLARPVELLYEVGSLGTSAPSGSQAFLPGFEESLVVVWMLGSAAVFLLFAGGWLRLHRQRRPWEPRRVGGEHVLLSDNLGPAVLGLIRPLIVLPRWALTLPKQDLDTVILHEKEHREARDPALLAVGLLLTALSPWNPMVWWSLSRLRLAVEGDCDGRVLARGVSPKAYMRFLVDVASRGGRVPALVPALVEARNTSLEKRLLMMRSKIGAHRAWASVLAATVGVALIVVACETPVPSEVELDEKAVAAVAQVDCLEGGAIREAVAAGEMTVEEGRALYAKCTEAGEREVRGGIRGRLGTAVREGWITREQAGVVVRELEIEGRRVREALSVEEMTAEEAKLAVIRAEFTAFGTQVEERVAVGELTTVEAREAVGAYQAQVSVVKKVPVDYSAKTER